MVIIETVKNEFLFLQDWARSPYCLLLLAEWTDESTKKLPSVHGLLVENCWFEYNLLTWSWFPLPMPYPIVTHSLSLYMCFLTLKKAKRNILSFLFIQ